MKPPFIVMSLFSFWIRDGDGEGSEGFGAAKEP